MGQFVVKIAVLLLAQLPLVDLTASVAHAATQNDLGLWTPIFFNAPIRGRWWGYFEANPRINENVSKFDQLLIRPALGYRFSRNGYIYNGFCWASNYNLPKVSMGNEYRIFQQAVFKNELGKLTLNNRTRLEERLFDYINGCSVRARHYIRGAYPIGRTNWYLVGSEELFVNLNSLRTDLKAGFEQNRLYGGLGRNINKHTSVEIGYQWQYVNRNDPADNIGRSAIMIQVYNNWL